MTSLCERKSSANVAIVLRRSRADSVVEEVIASDATMVLRITPALHQAGAGNKEIVHHGISLRNLRQETVVRHERLSLAPSHQAPLESEHPARTRPGRWHSHAHQYLHGLSSFGQDRQARSTQGRRLNTRIKT